MPTEPITLEVTIDASQHVDKLASISLSTHLMACNICRHYLRRRGSTLVLAVAVEANRRDVHAGLLLASYFRSVHARHLAGESLSTRPRTPDRNLPDGGKQIHVSRSCNGCQADLGDIREDELDAAMSGGRLPDVRLECGCWSGEDAA